MVKTSPLWWQQDIHGARLEGQPFQTDTGDWSALHQHFQDIRVYELAAGMGTAPELDYLRRYIVDTPHVHVWLAYDQGRHVGYLVYSIYTTTPRIAAYFFDPVWDNDLWRDAIDLLSSLGFQNEPQEEYMFVHTTLPVAPDTHAWLGELGFAQWDADMLLKEPPRAIYGLERAVYEMYHEQLDEDADLDDD